MTSAQAAKYLLTGGFVAVELHNAITRERDGWRREAESRDALLLAIKTENEKLRAYADHTYHCGAKRGDKCDCGYSSILQPNKSI